MKTYWLNVLIILFFLAAGVYLYPYMPDRMASHWNAAGEVDGYMPKLWGLFLIPLISVFLLLLFLVIPKIDPLKHNIEKFRKQYDIFVTIVILFLFYVHSLTIMWSLGTRFEMVQALSPAMGGLFYYCGVLVGKAKQNWFVGIRTPWTLSSERVWDKTHRIGAKLFKIAGVIAVLGFFFPDYALLLVIVPLVLVAVYTTVYSYFEYQKETRKGK
jgi:uncharacterized membrane protein